MVSLFPKQCSQNIYFLKIYVGQVIQVELFVFDH